VWPLPIIIGEYQPIRPITPPVRAAAATEKRLGTLLYNFIEEINPMLNCSFAKIGDSTLKTAAKTAHR
jgi:hypothetical protein